MGFANWHVEKAELDKREKMETKLGPRLLGVCGKPTRRDATSHKT